MKISVIGIGKVGSTVAFVLARDGLATELLLHNRTRAIARAEAIDIQQSVALTPHRLCVRDGDLEDTAGSDILILCASAPMRNSMRDRSELLRANSGIMRNLIPPLMHRSPGAILINVSNPVDALTLRILEMVRTAAGEDDDLASDADHGNGPTAAAEISPSGAAPCWRRVIGTGTLIDSARFRQLLAVQVGVHPADINAYILGEHGDSQFAALSTASCGGEFVDATPSRQKMVEEAKRSAWTIFQAKGYTNYTVSLAVSMIVRSIVEDLRSTMPVSVWIDGYGDVRDCCLSVPCVIGRQGVLRRLRPRLNDEERQAFRHCAQVVRRQLEQAGHGLAPD